MKALGLAALLVAAASSGCDAGRSLTSGPVAARSAPGAPVCGVFKMPNAPAPGLPNPEAYALTTDGTVADLVTGLEWERTADERGYSWEEAAAVCAAKGDGWRVPTRLELLSLVDFDVPAPGPAMSSIFGGAEGATFWTSSLYYGDAGDAWIIGFDRGYSDYSVRNNPSRVRCMRAPVTHCLPARYEVLPQGQVIDHATELIWQRAPEPDRYSWEDALARCAGRGRGWRVPSLTELQTIADDHFEFPAIDLDVFPGTPSEVFWTSTIDAAGSGSAWYVDFFYGASDNDVPAREYRARCVR